VRKHQNQPITSNRPKLESAAAVAVQRLVSHMVEIETLKITYPDVCY